MDIKPTNAGQDNCPKRCEWTAMPNHPVFRSL